MKQYIFYILVAFCLSACSELELGSHLAKSMNDDVDQVGAFKVGNPYRVKGELYNPTEVYEGTEYGVASWYGPGFHGKMTANGEIFNKHELTAAHKTLQLPSIVRVTNMDNGRSIIVRVNDRGPFAHDRVIDLSEKAATMLGFKNRGTANVKIDVLGAESRQVANAARQGLSTRGAEIALNRRQRLTEFETVMPKPYAKPYVDPTVAKRVMVAQNSTVMYDAPTSPYNVSKPDVPMGTSTQSFDSMLANRVLIERKTVTSGGSSIPNKKYIVQAGAFASEDNAFTMKTGLYNVGAPVNVYRTDDGGRILYRVQIGPVTTLESANEIRTMLASQGRDARIVTLEN